MDTIGKRSDAGINSSLSLRFVLSLTVLLIILILSINFISAVQIGIKSEYNQDETLIAKITGNFIDALSSGNVFFYRGHTRIPMQFTLSQIDSDYYLYALLAGKSPENYSIRIEGVSYKVGTQIHDETVIQNFTITNKTADFYVSPGFVETNDTFILELTNLRDNKVKVDITYENSSGEEKGFFASLFGTGETTENVELNTGESKEVSFDFASMAADLNESAFKTIKLESENTSYSIPVYLEVENQSKKTLRDTGRLSFTPLSQNISMATNSTTTRVVYLENNDDKNSVENISLYVSDELKPYINLSIINLSEIDENSSIKINFQISSGNIEKNLSGKITAEYENLSDSSEHVFATSEIFINLIKDYIPTYKDNVTIIDTKTCAELNGFICNVTIQTCPGKSVYAKDNNCCLVECNTIEKTDSTTTWKYIGWALVALVVLFVFWFLKKRKANQSVDLLKVARGK